MSMSQNLAEHIEAAFAGLWVHSFEHEDALAEITRLCHQRRWSAAAWDVDRGLRLLHSTGGSEGGGIAATIAASTDPLAALRALTSLAPGPDCPDGSALLVLPNFHRLLHSAEIVQALAHQIHLGKQNRTFVIILAPLVQIPVELEKQLIVIEHDLPDRDQLLKIAQGVATEAGELPQDVDLHRLLDAAAGL